MNKLDRDGAAFGRTVKEIGSHLKAWPALCGIPWRSAEGKFQGVGDVLGLRALRYAEGGDGKEINVFGLEQLETEDEKCATELKKARIALIELLSEHDDEIVERYLEADENHLAIATQDVVESIRRCVLRDPQQVVPVFAGASFRNIGVQPLLDAVVDLLPSPLERPDPEVSFGGEISGGLTAFLAGKLALTTPEPKKPGKGISKDKTSTALQNLEASMLAFKVAADPKRGVLVYVRVYSGVVNRNSALWNTNLQVTERSQRLLKMYANDAVEVDSISSGQIGVIPGLKMARTGDTLISYTGFNPKTGPPAPMSNLQLRPIDVPPPVFFVSVEPNSLAEEKHIKENLEILLREDPSLHVSVDEESGQTHLSGMGELHLEIARDRLVTELKSKARIGRIEIGYREALAAASDPITEVFDRELGGKSSKAACVASVEPTSESDDGANHEGSNVFRLSDGNVLTISMPSLHEDGSAKDPEKPGIPAHLDMRSVLQALQTGVTAALARGPTHGYPVHSISIHITLDPADHLFANTTVAALSSAARFAVQRAVKESANVAATTMMEPVMLATITVDEDSVGAVVHDISSARGGSILSLGSDEDEQATDKSLTIDTSKIYAPLDAFAGGHSSSDAHAGASINAARQVVARVPLKEMIGYLKHLRSLTGGRGTFTMAVDRFEKMSTQRERALLNEMRGEYV